MKRREKIEPLRFCLCKLLISDLPLSVCFVCVLAEFEADVSFDALMLKCEMHFFFWNWVGSKIVHLFFRPAVFMVALAVLR